MAVLRSQEEKSPFFTSRGDSYAPSEVGWMITALRQPDPTPAAFLASSAMTTFNGRRHSLAI
ncbi:hypothetical protein E1264_23595 [Actinomadura sp. KC216]|uniref:hypothetical protein n=1 Tax=Actinomadura sp. KC216 TaxID=2530370 RepID=UPI00104B9095|nr:hypothetical protein [Actinomadura sp. KC216]TDB84742.1 hypothetical protein E1264_23595 [Actinomadura sp. KC216]